MNDDPQFNQLRAIIDGDGSEIRRQFILAGLFLTIFERFKKCLVDCVDSFFSHRTEIKDGNLFHIRGEEFKKLIKEKGFDEAGQHKNKAFRAALYWFHDLGAITKQEFDEVERILYSTQRDWPRAVSRHRR